MIYAKIKDVDMQFETESTLFSPNFIDGGTLAMLSEVDFLPGDKVLDLGCGYGVAGIVAGKLIGEERVIMCDISEQAVKYASINAALNGLPQLDIRLSDGFQNIQENDFTIILCNPPYHTDFSVPKKMIEGGFKRLAMGGKLVMVTKRLLWYKNKLTSVFGGVQVRERDGYYVFIAEKRSRPTKKKTKPAMRLSKKLQRKQKGLKANLEGAIRKPGLHALVCFAAFLSIKRQPDVDLLILKKELTKGFSSSRILNR